MLIRNQKEDNFHIHIFLSASHDFEGPSAMYLLPLVNLLSQCNFWKMKAEWLLEHGAQRKCWGSLVENLWRWKSYLKTSHNRFRKVLGKK